MMGSMAAAGIISDMMGSIMSEIASRQKAKKAFKRQKMLMKNMIQWRVKDLQKAGLNPMLATGAGVGGQSAMVQQAGSGGEGEGPDMASFASAGNLLMAAKRLDPEIENINANTGVSNRQADNIQQDTLNKQEQRWNIEQDTMTKQSEAEKNSAIRENQLAQIEVASQTAKNLDIRTKVMALGIEGLKNQFNVDASKAGEILNWINNITHTAKGVTDVLPIPGRGQPESPRIGGFE